MSAAVFVMDVGSVRPSKRSPRGAFGWSRATMAPGDSVSVIGGTSIASLLAAIEVDATSGMSLTLGVEAPLWIPVPDDGKELSRGRRGDGARSCFAPAGGYVATLGLHQFAHVVGRLPSTLALTLDWTAWSPNDPSRLLVWEAFVSEKAHAVRDAGDGHVRDAATAAVEFLRLAASPLAVGTVAPDDRAVFSLAGAALLWSGRASDTSVLRSAALVVRPSEPYTGPIMLDDE